MEDRPQILRPAKPLRNTSLTLHTRRSCNRPNTNSPAPQLTTPGDSRTVCCEGFLSKILAFLLTTTVRDRSETIVTGLLS